MIHLIWKGYGFLVAVFVVGFLMIADLITIGLTGGKAYWASHTWPFALSMFAAAAACWFVGRYFHERKSRVLFDLENCETVVLRESHTFFFMPIMWWGPILAVYGVIMFLVEITK